MSDGSEPFDLPQRRKRQRLPTTMGRVDATFCSPNGTSIKGRLWDINLHGAAIQFNQDVTIAENTIGRRVLQHRYTNVELELEAEVCWVDHGPPRR